MTPIDYISIGLLIIMGYIIIYSFINRICCCIEKCAVAKMFSNRIDDGSVSMKDLDIEYMTGKNTKKEN